MVGCYILKRDARDVVGPDAVRELRQYAILPIEVVRNPMRRARAIFDLVCPGVTPDASQRTPQQAYYQALIDSAVLEAKAIEWLEHPDRFQAGQQQLGSGARRLSP